MARAAASWTNTEATDWEAGDFVEATKLLQQVLQNLEYLAQSHDHTGDPDGLALPATSITAHASRHNAGGADVLALQAHGPSQHTTGTAWRLVYQDASGDEQEIALGAATTVLTSDGASVAPSFQAAAGGAVQAPWGLWVPDPLFTISDAVWPSANRALFLPFIVLTTVTVTRILIRVNTQSGNLDVGIYNASRTRLVSSGSIAVAVAGAQVINIVDTELVAGRYYFAMAVDNVTANFARAISYANSMGRWQYEDAAFPLPASVAAFDGFANYAPVAVLEISGGISVD